MFLNWISENWIEIFGAVSGIVYVFLEIRQNPWLWPVGIITSAVYILIFFTGKLYADMSLQGYYLVISLAGWYWWVKGAGRRAKGEERRTKDAGQVMNGTGEELRNSPLEGGQGDVKQGTGQEDGQGNVKLEVTHLQFKTGLVLTSVFVLLYFSLWVILSRFTDSPVPEADSFITSLSIVATWMLARKIYEHWYLWIIVNSASVLLFLNRDLLPTVILYVVYLIMSFAGLKAWKKV